jgi:hypothetical protein
MKARERSEGLLILLTREPQNFSRPDLENAARWLAQRCNRLTNELIKTANKLDYLMVDGSIEARKIIEEELK